MKKLLTISIILALASTLLKAGSTYVGKFIGDGSSLTNVAAGSATNANYAILAGTATNASGTGTVTATNDSRSLVLTNVNNQFAGTLTGSLQLTQPGTGVTSNTGSNILSASGVLYWHNGLPAFSPNTGLYDYSNSLLVLDSSGNINGHLFTGNGSGLTNLPYAQGFSSTNGYWTPTVTATGSTNWTFTLTNLPAVQLTGTEPQNVLNGLVVTNASLFITTNGITDPVAESDLNDMFYTMMDGDGFPYWSGTNRLAQLNNFWLFGQRFGWMTNSYLGTPAYLSNAIATPFGRKFLGSAISTAPVSQGILPVSVSPTNTIVFVMRISQSDFNSWIANTPVNAVGTTRPLIGSLTDTNSNSGYYFGIGGYFGNGGASPAVYDRSNSVWYDSGNVASSTSNRCNLVNSGGIVTQTLKEWFYTCVFTYSSFGDGRHAAWFDGIPCVFGSNPYSLIWTNYQPASIPSSNMNAINISFNNTWNTNSEGSHCALACEMMAVFLFNGADTNMGRDTYQIASWVPAGNHAGLVDGDSLISDYYPAGTISDYQWNLQYGSYIANALNVDGDDFVFVKATGGSSFTTETNVPVIGSLPLTEMTDLPNKKWSTKKAFSNQGHNNADTLAAGYYTNVVVMFTNYYLTLATNRVAITFSASQLFNTNNTFYNAADTLTRNADIWQYNEAMKNVSIISGYDDHQKFIENATHNLIDSATDHIHPVSSNSPPYHIAYANFALFNVPVPSTLQTNLQPNLYSMWNGTNWVPNNVFTGSGGNGGLTNLTAASAALSGPFTTTNASGQLVPSYDASAETNFIFGTYPPDGFNTLHMTRDEFYDNTKSANQIYGQDGASVVSFRLRGGDSLINNIADQFNIGLKIISDGSGHLGSTLSFGGAGVTNSGNFITTGTGSYIGNGIGLTNLPGTYGLLQTNLAGCTIQTNIVVYTVPTGQTNDYQVGGFINVTAVSVDVIQAKVLFTDENNVSQTVNLMTSGVSTIQFSPMVTSQIRAKGGTTITLQATLTTGAGSITYDCGGNIEAKL